MDSTLVYQALREPEAFAAAHAALPSPRTLAALIATASLGVGTYGAAMHAWDGAAAMGENGLLAIAAAGIAWTASLPTLLVLGAMNGSQLRPPAVALATLITVSFGGLAMLASIPVLLYFELCVPHTAMRFFVNALVFSGVGLCMSDVFLRVMARLEGFRFLHLAWLALLSVVGAEMFYVLGLFNL